MDEQELLDLYKSTKHKDYLGTLLQSYTLMLFGVGMKYLKNEEAAKDAVQQTFEKVLTEFDKHEVTYFKAWLYTMMKNHCLMTLRKKGVDTTPYEQYHDYRQYHEEDEQLWEKERDLDLLQEALEELKSLQQDCIRYFYLEKRSYAEIAEMMQLSLKEVKSHIQNGKRNLKIIIERKQNHE